MVGLTTLPAGWTETSLDDGDVLVTFDDVACTPVVPVDPTVVQATCTAGEVTVPTVTPRRSTGVVTYTLDPTGSV